MKGKWTSICIVIFILLTSFNPLFAQNESIISKLKTLTNKGDYIILEVRLNKEDEFRTIEGSKGSLTRISIFTGNNEGAEVITKEFNGFNAIVRLLNKLKKNGWYVIDTYQLGGESLIITHYLIEKRKK